LGGNSAVLSLSDEIEKQFAPDVNGHPNFGSKCRRLHRCELWGGAKDCLAQSVTSSVASGGLVADAVNIAGVCKRPLARRAQLSISVFLGVVVGDGVRRASGPDVQRWADAPTSLKMLASTIEVAILSISAHRAVTACPA